MGLGVAVVMLALALFSKLAAVLLTIPGPVLGAYLMLAMGMLFVSGWQTILRDGLDSRRVLVVALASALGLGLHNHAIMRDLFGDEMGSLLGNGVTIGAVVAIGMTLALEAAGARRSRLETTMDMASLPAIDEFLAAAGGQARLERGVHAAAARPPARRRSPACKCRTTIAEDSESPAPDHQRAAARRDGGAGVRRHDAAGERGGPAGLPERRGHPADVRRPIAAAAAASYAAAVRHQKFYGVDIVTVHITGGG